MAFTIPGGHAKGTEITAAAPKDLEFWIGKISKDLTENPEKRFADKDAAWVAAARSELARRANGGAQEAPKAAAPSQAIARTAPAQMARQDQGPRLSVSQLHDPAVATQRLLEAAALYHIVSPATSVDALPPGCGVALSMVKIDPNTDKNGPGDVVSVVGKLMLSANALKRVAAAAGVDWDPMRTGRLDNGRDPHYCHYRAVGTVRNFDGSVRTLTGEVEMDAREGSPQLDEIREKAAERARKNPDYKNDGGASQILELRKFLLRHAETKAKNRAIVDMGLKRSYTAAELEKPFAVARLMWTGQTEDPELRREFARMHAANMLGGTAALYGHQQQAPALPAPQQQWQGHAPPALGAVNEYDYGGADYETTAERLPSSPRTTTPDVDMDRGNSAEAY